MKQRVESRPAKQVIANECVFGHKSEPNIQISKYRSSRYFAIYLNGDLLAVTVYKKGAVAIREALTRHGIHRPPQPAASAESSAPRSPGSPPPRPRADDF